MNGNPSRFIYLSRYSTESRNRMLFKVLTVNGQAVIRGVMAESSEVPTAKRRRRIGSVYCGHCKQRVPTSTYYRHREQFFDVVTQQWQCHTAARANPATQDSSDEEGFELQTTSEGIMLCRENY